MPMCHFRGFLGLWPRNDIELSSNIISTSIFFTQLRKAAKIGEKFTCEESYPYV